MDDLQGLRLSDWHPVSQLRAASTQLTRTAVPAIDIHNHLGRWLSDGEWMIADVPGLIATMDECNIATVVNLDGVVNPDAAEATRDGTLPRYMARQRLDWVADFSLRVIGFVVADAKQMHPEPTVEPVPDLPQYPPFPDYGAARITWPSPTAPADPP